MSRVFAFFTILSFCALFLVSCQKRPLTQRTDRRPLPEEAEIASDPLGKFGGRLIDVHSGEPNTFNPLISEDASSSAMISLLATGLTTYDPVQEKVMPGLAQRWEISPEGKTFTFHLRKGLRWSDGAALTTDDIIFTFQAIYDKRLSTRAAYDYSVDGKPFEVRKIDDLTFELRTPDIYAPLLLMLGSFEILPKHQLEQAYKDATLMKIWTVSTAQQTPAALLSTGAFKLHSYRPGERIVFEPNPYYYRANQKRERLPYIDYYIAQFVKDQNASTIAFATGLTDSEGFTPDQVAWVEKAAKTYDFKIYDRGPSTSSSFIWFNQNPGENKDGKPFVAPHKLKWFTDQRFRQAISYAIDRQGIVDGVLFGRGAPLWGPESPANKKWFNPDVKKYPFDLKKAQDLLTKAGFKKDAQGALRDSDQNIVEFSLITNQENLIRQSIATVFMENMKALGIHVQLQFQDFGTFVNRIQDSYDYEAGLLGFTGGGDPVGGMSIYVSSGRLHQWNPNQKSPATPWEARIDELMVKQLKTLDEAKRKEYYNEVQLIMSEQVPFIYLVTPNSYAGLKNRWRNLNIPTQGSLLWNVDAIWTVSP